MDEPQNGAGATRARGRSDPLIEICWQCSLEFLIMIQAMSKYEETGCPLALLDELYANGELINPFPKWLTGVEVDSDKHNTELASIIEEDPRLTAAVLRYANNAIYSGTLRFESVEDAILRLGYARVKEILLACYVEGFYHNQSIPKGRLALVRDVFDHSIATGICCRELASVLNYSIKPPTAYTAGLLHHLGLYWLLCRVEWYYENACHALQNDVLITDWVQAEGSTLGRNHAEVGGRMLQLWGLPESLQLAVWLHHEPPQETLAELVRIGSLIANTPMECKEELKDRLLGSIQRLEQSWWDKNKKGIEKTFDQLGGLRGRLNVLCSSI